MAKIVPGRNRTRWQAAPTPERPAPTMRTSKCAPGAPAFERSSGARVTKVASFTRLYPLATIRGRSLIRPASSTMLNRRGTGGGQHDLDRGNAQRCQEKAMILANILVHLDSKPRTAARVALSLRIAERAGARLTGLFAEKADAHQVGTVATWPSAHYTAAMEGARAAFAAATAPLKDRAAF